jgi:chromosome partitioning protein
MGEWMRTILIANRKGGCGKTVTAITLASGLAASGARVALADADQQRSALRWLRQRPAAATPITGLDWSRKDDVGEAPGKTDWLVVDAPGAIRGGRAEALIAEADVVLAPVLPSFFDSDSTRRFLKDIEELKRIRKGKAAVHLIANRVRARSHAAGQLESFFAGLGQVPLAWIGERAAYAELAEQGLAVFDKPQRAYAPLRAQWAPVIAAIA